VITIFLAWLDLLGIERERLRGHVVIHETADVGGAERCWGELTGLDASAFRKTTLKRHNPKTVRMNTGQTYRGCLAINVLQGCDFYRRIEGWWAAIVQQAEGSLR
jgi:hypothetical protein